MDRSPGFGSIPSDSTPYSDSVSLRLPYSVKLATENNSLTHYTKGTPSPSRAPTACTHAVSGSISLPSPGFFSPFPHGTGPLSVSWEYLALEDGPPIFSQDSTCPDLLVASLVPRPHFRVRGYHPVSRTFPDASPSTDAITCRLLPFRSPLLRESRLISFPPGTEMFQFPGFASATYEFSRGYPAYTGWVTPFGNPRITARLPAPRGLSQAPTSFIPSSCQGIHRMRFVA